MFLLCCVFALDIHQHPRQRVPGVGLSEGAAAAPASELHPAGSGLHVRPAAASVDQPAGVLQVSAVFYHERFHDEYKAA